MAPVKKGQVLFEINCFSTLLSKYVLTKACSKLPLKAIPLQIRY